MKKDEIKKKISQYTRWKMIITEALLLCAVSLCTSIIAYRFFSTKGVMYWGIISYVFMVVVLIVACKFNFNQVTIDVNTIDDFKEILEYLSEIPENICDQTYSDILHIITNSLKKHVYYGEKNEDELLEKHLRYLQISVFSYKEKIQMFSSELLDNKFLKKISKEMLSQIKVGIFNPSRLDDSVKNKKNTRRYVSISEKVFKNICNAFLIIIIAIKFFITCNNDWYNSINENSLGRIFYNTGADIMAAILAMVALKSKE